jgi:hypothetical protein
MLQGVKPQNIIVASSSAEYVTTRANTIGEFSEIARIQPPLGQLLYVPNKTVVNGTTLTGFGCVLQLKDNTNTELPGDAELCIGLLTPQDPARRPRYIVRVPYQTWAGLSTTDQKNERFRSRIAQSVDLNMHPLEIREDDKLILEIKSGVQVDWTKSFFELPLGKINK